MQVYDENTEFKVWAEKWEKRKTIGMNYTYIKSTDCLIKHLNEYFGDIPIKDIRLMNIEDMIIDLSIYNPNTKKPASKKLLKNLKATTKAIFNFAILNCDNLIKNPADSVQIPKNATQTERKAISSEEQITIFNTQHTAQLPALIMMCCGLRVGELIALKWDKVDFTNHILKIEQSAYQSSGNCYSIKSGTKNGKCRYVPIPNTLYNQLLSYNKHSNSKYITSKADGDIHTPSSWNKLWIKYQKCLGITVTPHQLRHTYASMLYFSGVDVKSASELLGHSDISITMKVYTHLQEKQKIISINKYDTYLTNLLENG